MLSQTGSGSNSTANCVAQNSEVKNKVLVCKMWVTGAGETSLTFPKEAMKTFPEWPNIKWGKLVQTT